MKPQNWIKKALIAICLTSLLTSLTLQSTTIASTDFTTVINSNLANWGLDNPNSSLTYDEVSLLLEDNKITGENAAALAAICQYMRLHKKSSNLAITKSLALNTIATDHSTLKFYNNYCHQLSNIPESLYAKQSPDFATLQQGHADDCFFFSAIGWLAKYRPETIMNSITENTNQGTYTVKFPSGESVTVNTPTQAEILFNNSAESIKNGLWITILEKATGILLSQTGHKAYDAADPQTYIDSGGNPEPIEQMWSGSKPTTLKFNTSSEKIWRANQIRHALITMQKENLLAQAGGVVSSGNDLPLPGHHVYAILAYDDNIEVLTMWNPWGTDFTPQGPDGLTYGYTRQHGVFNISLQDFIQIYGYMCMVAIPYS